MKGVTKTTKSKREPKFSVRCPFDKASLKGRKYLKFLEDQVGKKYDFKAVLFGFWGFKCESETKWYCSELSDTYFSLYLKTTSKIKTTVSPKLFFAKIEAFLDGCKYGK